MTAASTKSLFAVFLRPTSGRRFALHRITWVLLALSCCSVTGATLAVAVFSPRDLGQSSAAYAARFALGHAAEDSWMPMRLALEELRGPSAHRLYPSLFFERKIKFQYPPSSLLPLELIQWLSGGRLDPVLLNRIGWFCVLALACLVPAIYLRAMRDFRPEWWRRFSPLDLRAQALAVAILSLTFYPVTRGFVLGQIQTWLTCLFATALLAWLYRREGLAGAIIGAMVCVKPQLAVLLVWGAVQRRRSFVIAAAAVVVLLQSISLWRFGLENQIGYLSVLSYLSAHGESFFANQSVNGLLSRLLRVGNNLEWDERSFPPFHPVVYYSTLVSSVLMIALALLWRRREHGTRAMALKFCLASVLATMASPIAWEHHYGVLLPVFAVVFPVFLGDFPRHRRLLGLAVAYVCCANAFPFANRAAATPWNFVQSYLFAGALLLVAMVTITPGLQNCAPPERSISRG
jgi:alpha-1,2-mannosyltransferase